MAKADRFKTFILFMNLKNFTCRKARVQISGQTSKRKYKIINSATTSLSRFLAKSLWRVNKIAMKSFSNNLSFGVDF